MVISILHLEAKRSHTASEITKMHRVWICWTTLGRWIGGRHDPKFSVTLGRFYSWFNMKNKYLVFPWNIQKKILTQQNFSFKSHHTIAELHCIRLSSLLFVHWASFVPISGYHGCKRSTPQWVHIKYKSHRNKTTDAIEREYRQYFNL